MSFPFKNLVFQGGGVLGTAYAGAVRVLAERGILDQVENVAGTSAGAIASLMLALRYSVDEMEAAMLDADFKNFTSESRPLEFHERYGWYTTEPLRKWLRNHVKRAGKNFAGASDDSELSGDETFEELAQAGARHMRVFATDLNRRAIREFSRRKTPGVRVVDAVTASLTIPAFFQSFQFPNNNPDDHIYVDGGALLNYPIVAFDEGSINKETLGFSLDEDDNLGAVSDLQFGTFRRWAEHLYETVKKVQLNLLSMHPEHRKRTVFIDTGNISPVNFEIADEQKEWLIGQGRRATEDYLKFYEYQQSFRYRLVNGSLRLMKNLLPAKSKSS